MKNKFKGTPGNWSVSTKNKEVISIDTDLEIPFGDDSSICGIHIADCDPQYFKVCLADAHLISAAPELLEACLEFVRKCESGEARSTRSYNQMKTAIEKALGTKSEGI